MRIVPPDDLDEDADLDALFEEEEDTVGGSPFWGQDTPLPEEFEELQELQGASWGLIKVSVSRPLPLPPYPLWVSWCLSVYLRVTRV